MKRIISLLMVTLFMLISVGCSKTVVNYHDQGFPYNESKPTMKQLDKAIVEAGAKRGWIMQKKAKGFMIATINVRNHMVQVDVKYNREAFSITYRDSINMSYNPQRKTIHRKYNTWVMNLRNDIQATVPLAVME